MSGLLATALIIIVFVFGLMGASPLLILLFAAIASIIYYFMRSASFIRAFQMGAGDGIQIIIITYISQIFTVAIIFYIGVGFRLLFSLF